MAVLSIAGREPAPILRGICERMGRATTKCGYATPSQPVYTRSFEPCVTLTGM
jgi:hypothetical protein